MSEDDYCGFLLDGVDPAIQAQSVSAHQINTHMQLTVAGIRSSVIPVETLRPMAAQHSALALQLFWEMQNDPANRVVPMAR